MAPIHIGQPWQVDPRKLILRPFDGSEADFGALARVRNATLQAVTLPEDYHEATPAGMEQHYRRADFSLPDNAWLMFYANESVAGAVVYPASLFSDRPPGNFEVFVVPSYERHGIGSRLLAHLEEAARARGHRVLETTIASEDSASVGFLSARGFSVVSRALHLVLADMGPMPEAVVPPGYSILSLAGLGEPPETYMETANRLGAYDDNYTLIRPEELARLVAGSAWEPEGILLLLAPASRIVGVIRASGATSQARRGYLHEIRLEPTSRGQGLGTALVTAALRYLQAAGVQRVELDTSGENRAAQALATRAGFVPARHWLHLMKSLPGSEI